MAKRNPNRPETLEARRLLSAAPSLANASDVDMAYDVTGALHLAFHDTAAHNLQYAWRSPAGDWSDATVVDASSADTGAQVSLAVDASGRPGLAYRDVANADLKYAYLGEGGAWLVQTVDGSRKADTGVQPDLAFDATNTPVISYYRPTGGKLRLATLVRGRWRGRNVARVGGPEHASSDVAISPATGQWAVAYERADGSVRYTAIDGKRVRTTVIDRLAAPGARPSVAFDADGLPAFSYYDVAGGLVKLARLDAVGWSVSEVAPTDGQGHGSTLLVEPGSDAIQVVYRDAGGSSSVASGTLEAVTFSVRSLGGITGDAAAPVVVADPTGRTLVTAYAGSTAALASTLDAAGNLSVLSISTDSVALTWSDSADAETAYEVQQSDDGGATFATVVTLPAGAVSAEVTGLADGHAYVFRVVTCDAAGNRVNSDLLHVTTLPAAATDMAAPAVTPGRVELSWHDNTDAEDGYRVERRAGDGSEETSWELLATLDRDATGYVDESVSAGATYQYRVVAVVGEVRNPGPAALTVAVPVVAPTTFSAGSTQARRVDLSWSDAVGEAGYIVERAAFGSDAFAPVATLDADVTGYADTNLPEDAVFTYRVRSVGAERNSAPTGTASVAVRLATPGLPSAAPASDTSLVLTWQDNSSAEIAYRVQWSIDGAAFTTYIDLPADSDSLTVANLSGGSTYRFRLIARGAHVDSALSTTALYTIAPFAPAGLSAVALGDATRADLLWADPHNNRDGGFRIERSADGGDFEEVATVGVGVTHFIDEGLTPGVEYAYRVRGTGAWGDSPYSDVAITAGPDLSPTAVAVTAATQTQLYVSWEDNCPREAGYIVRYGDGVHEFELSVPADETSAAVSGLVAGLDYSVQVVTKMGDGAEWASGPVTVVMLVAPPDLSVAVGDAAGHNLASAVTLTWSDENTGESGYVIERSEDGGDTYDVIANLSGPSRTTYTDNTIPEDTTYRYRVYAYSPNGVGTPTAGVPNVPATWLYAPSGVSATPSGASHVDLHWSDNSGAETQYVVAMSRDNLVYFEIATVDSSAGGGTDLAVTEDMFHAPLAASTTYYFKVMAVSPANGSDWSSPASVTTPSAV